MNEGKVKWLMQIKVMVSSHRQMVIKSFECIIQKFKVVAIVHP